MKYSDDLIAKVLGACQAGIPHKVIAKAAGMPWRTVRALAQGYRRSSVKPDMSIMESFKQWMKCERTDLHIH